MLEKIPISWSDLAILAFELAWLAIWMRDCECEIVCCMWIVNRFLSKWMIYCSNTREKVWNMNATLTISAYFHSKSTVDMNEKRIAKRNWKICICILIHSQNIVLKWWLSFICKTIDGICFKIFWHRAIFIVRFLRDSTFSSLILQSKTALGFFPFCNIL